VIGVLGGIGSGKSAVASGLSQYFPTLLLDADKVGHELLAMTDVQTQLRSRFGSGIFAPDGSVDRRALASHVFGTHNDQRQARHDLNRILHPRIRAALEQRLAEVSPDIAVVVLDAAVMLEAGWDDLCQAIVFIDVPEADRVARVKQQRGWSEDELRQRESSQLSLDEKRRRSTAVIDNSKSLADAVQQLCGIIERLLTAS